MPMDLLLLVVLAAMLVFMFVSSRRRTKKMKEQQEERQRQLVPGVRIMTRAGLFGTLVSFDADDLTQPAEIEIAPGVVIEVHAQSIELAPENAPIVDEPAEADEAELEDDAPADGSYTLNGADVDELPGDDKPKL